MGKQKDRRALLKYLLASSAVMAGSSVAGGMRMGFPIRGVRPAAAKEKAAGAGRVKKIAVEEHFYPQAFSEALYSKTDWKGAPRGEAATKILEYGKKRIEEMDACGVDMQMLSLSYPAIDPFKTEDAISVSRMVNDEIAETVGRHPDRFSGFCCLPLQDPDAAAAELERAVGKLGLKGAMVNINTPERWLSDKKYEVVFATLAKLDVPLYLHADGPSTEDSGLHIVPEVMRLVNSELLLTYPNLQFILGHAGESLPFWLNRLDGRWMYPERPKTFSQYFRDHFYVALSSQCWNELLTFLIASVGSDRIMFAADYPYESLKQHVEFIESAQISNEDRAKICYRNAETLFGL
jgi:2,3-dihydroxybenzoate decarboxylase